MAKNLINDYPYTNMTYQNVDWLVEIVSKLVEKGKDNGEIKADDEVNAAYGQFINNYPYTNMTYQNIDWWINKVREIGAEQVKLIAQMETLQADVDNIVDKFGDKVDKLTTAETVYATDNSTPPKTVGIRYTENAGEEGTIVMRDGIGSIAVPTAQDAQQAVPLEQMQQADAELNNKIEALDAETESALANKVSIASGNRLVYVNAGQAGVATNIAYDANSATGTTFPLRTSTGTIRTATPTDNNDAATKKYVDDAVKTGAGGGWVTIIDKTWTEDQVIDYSTFIDIPTEYQKQMSAIRMTYYNDTPQAGAVYNPQIVNIGLVDSEKAISFMYTANILPTKDSTDITVDFTSNSYEGPFNSSGYYDSNVDSYGMLRFKDSSGNYIEPIPTNPNAILNTSKITKAMVSGSEDTVNWTIDSYLPNRTHTFAYPQSSATPTVVTFKSNDYYNSEHSTYILSQVIETSDSTNLPVGSFVCNQDSSLVWVAGIEIKFSSTTSISYKNVVTRQAVVVGESIQVIAGSETLQHAMTSFNSRVNGNPLPSGYAYYNGLKDGYPTKINIVPSASTSSGVTSNTIYAGSRIVVQAQY